MAAIGIEPGISNDESQMSGPSSVVAFELSSWDRVKPGVTVLEVPVGGLTQEQAQAQLAPRALSILDQSVQVQLDQGGNATNTSTVEQNNASGVGVNTSGAGNKVSVTQGGSAGANSNTSNVLQIGNEHEIKVEQGGDKNVNKADTRQHSYNKNTATVQQLGTNNENTAVTYQYGLREKAEHPVLSQLIAESGEIEPRQQVFDIEGGKAK